MRIVSIKMNEKLHEAVMIAYKLLGFDNKSELIRTAIITYLRLNLRFFDPETRKYILKLIDESFMEVKK